MATVGIWVGDASHPSGAPEGFKGVSGGRIAVVNNEGISCKCAKNEVSKEHTWPQRGLTHHAPRGGGGGVKIIST